MARSNPFQTLADLSAFARHRGYTVRLGEWLGNERMMDISGHGELFEATFRLSEDRNMVWVGGFRHLGVKGDKIRTLRLFKDLLDCCAGNKPAKAWAELEGFAKRAGLPIADNGDGRALVDINELTMFMRMHMGEAPAELEG